jgi:hypothetical protein
MINSANVTVRASMTSVASAITDYIQSGDPLTYTSLILGKAVRPSVDGLTSLLFTHMRSFLSVQVRE